MPPSAAHEPIPAWIALLVRQPVLLDDYRAHLQHLLDFEREKQDGATTMETVMQARGAIATLKAQLLALQNWEAEATRKKGP
jgi:hypothetical protein